MFTVFLNSVFWREYVYSHISPEDGNKLVCKMLYLFRILNDVQSPDAQLSQTVRNVWWNYSCRIGEVCNNGNVFI